MVDLLEIQFKKYLASGFIITALLKSSGFSSAPFTGLHFFHYPETFTILAQYVITGKYLIFRFMYLLLNLCAERTLIKLYGDSQCVFPLFLD